MLPIFMVVFYQCITRVYYMHATVKYVFQSSMDEKKFQLSMLLHLCNLLEIYIVNGHYDYIQHRKLHAIENERITTTTRGKIHIKLYRKRYMACIIYNAK